MTQYIVTVAPPNPNGDLHVGHLSGPFLGADVLARQLRSTGHSVAHVGYIDEFSSYVPRRARELSARTDTTAHALGTRIELTLAAAGMAPDFCGRPMRDDGHREVIQRYFTRLWEAGAFSVETLPVFCCPQEGHPLYESEVRGRCPYCSAPSDGIYCEECGRALAPGGLVEASCTSCGAVPELTTLERIVFPLEDYRERLRSLYADREMRPRLRAYLDAMLAESLPLTPISRQTDYGVPVPLGDWSGHVLDTWYSGIFGYIAATGNAATVAGIGGGEDSWLQPDTQVYEFIGFDCSFSHALLWPALAMAAGDLTLPTQIITNEFYRLDGGKFSTSRGHAIWGADVLRAVPPDSLRFYLCLTGPEVESTDFVRQEFEKTTDELLADGLEVVCAALLERMSSAEAASTAPLATAGAFATGGRLPARVDQLVDEVARHLAPEHFSPAAAAQAVADFAVTARDWIEVDLPTLSPADCAEAAARIAVAVSALMPGWSSDVLGLLGVPPIHALSDIRAWPEDQRLVSVLSPAAGRPRSLRVGSALTST